MTACATLFVPAVPEFSPLVEAARIQPACEVDRPSELHFRIRSKGWIRFGRKAAGLKPAIWYGLATGGFVGRIEIFDSEQFVLVASDVP